MKKVCFLGGGPMQIPPIKYALEQGHRVILFDRKADNPGCQYAHEHHLLSITDYNAVLNIAKSLKVDGIVSYASDIGAPTAAYVGNILGLQSNPYESVLTLTRKDLFRSYLEQNNYNVPRSRSFVDFNEAHNWLKEIGLPAFVKPVDSCGSKGVTKVMDYQGFKDAFALALSCSTAGIVVVEEPIKSTSYQVAGDGFIVNGRLVFRCWGNEHFDKLCNSLAPIGESFPAVHDENSLETAHTESQRLISLLGMKTGALNFDFLLDNDGGFNFLELGPRNGGNLIPEVIKYASGENMVKYIVDAALGLDCTKLQMRPVKGYWSSYIVHSTKNGIFKELLLSKRIQQRIVEKNIWVRRGERVNIFSNSNDTLGTMILQFQTMSEMLDMMDNMERDVRVVLE